MKSHRPISQYRLEASLGSGAYTKVYRAVDTVRRRTVALKLLETDLVPGALSPASFLAQVDLASELVHPHLAWVWETGQDAGVYFIAERYIAGPSLAYILENSGALSWNEALKAFLQIAQGLDFAHNLGWLHLGIKPRNIVLSPELGAILTDFGIMRALQAGWQSDLDIFSDLDACYVPPEIWDGRDPSPASDQYALACLLVEMLTGRPLFDGTTTQEIAAKHQDLLELPYSLLQEVPWELSPLLERALAKEPSARYPAVADFARSLENLSCQDRESPQERVQREEAERSHQEAALQARLQAEELARLAALEQARREIEEQSHLEAQVYIEQNLAAGLPLATVKDPPHPPSEPKERQTRVKNWCWLIWEVLAIICLGLAFFWINQRYSLGIFQKRTPTASETSIVTRSDNNISITDINDSKPTLTKTALVTSSATRTGTPRPTSTNTPTLTYTNTNTPTISPTATINSSATPIPVESDQEDTTIRRKPANPGAIQGDFW